MGAHNHYRAEAEAKPVPICPLCGKEAREARTRYGLRASCCGLWSWDRHPLVSAGTHQARNAAHAAFDALWKGGLISRGQAYSRLGEMLGLTKEQCHMKLMDEATALRVPAAVERIRAEATS